MSVLITLITKHAYGFFSEVVTIATSKQKLRQLFSVPLYSNAIYLMTANVIAAISGFAFWIIAARFYPAEIVGLASAVLAAIGLLANLANLGLGYGLIRFLPNSAGKENNLLNSSFTISILASILISVIFLGGITFWSPALIFLRHEPVLLVAFIVFTIAFTLRMVGGEALIAKRRTGFLLVMGAIFNVLRLPLVILMAGVFHSFGIFGSWSISLWVALLFNFLLFLPRVQAGYRPRLNVSREVKGMLRFSSGNYISNLLRVAPVMILPIMVINILDPESTAYFSITWAVAGTVTMVAESASMSLFAEGSHDEDKLGINIGRSLKMVFLTLVPAVILVLVFADKLLLAFGSSYSESATTLLRILTLSAVPLAINTIYLSIKRVEKKLSILIGITALLAISILALSYILLPGMGITGVGIAWVISQGTVALVIIASFIKRHISSTRFSKGER